MSKKFPLISVVMPVYNENIQDLHDSINSILNQTYSHFEYIIVNDNPDNNVIKSYIKKEAQKDSRIKLIFNSTNLGLIKSENKGIRKSHGRYIARIDADDIARKNRLYIQLQFLINNNLDITCSNFSTIDVNKNIIDTSLYSSITQTDQYKIKKVMSYCNIAIGPTLFFKKQIFNSIHGYRNLSVDDYDFCARALVKGYKMGYQSKVMLYKRLRSNSISEKNVLQQYVLVSNISKCLRKYNYSKILKLNTLYFNINKITNKQLRSFHKFFIAYYYGFKIKKNFYTLFKVIISIFSSWIVIKRTLWVIFINKNQEMFMK